MAPPGGRHPRTPASGVVEVTTILTQGEGLELASITSDHIFQFLTQDTEGQKQSTKRFKYTLLKILFNFIKTHRTHLLSIPATLRR